MAMFLQEKLSPFPSMVRPPHRSSPLKSSDMLLEISFNREEKITYNANTDQQHQLHVGNECGFEESL